MNENNLQLVKHLVAGLEAIAALKDAKRCKDPLDELMGEPGEDEDGFRPIHPRMKRGMDMAARMARETLDTMPKVLNGGEQGGQTNRNDEG